VTAFRHTYSFKEGNAGMKDILGGKGANLAEMTNLGLPVPPGFTIGAKASLAYYDEGRKFPAGLNEEMTARMIELEGVTGKKFGDPTNPLLVSVRSGAAVSMPGMMDTVLNLGLNEVTVEGLAALTGNKRFAYDCYRRFIQMFSNVVLRFDISLFEHVLEETKAKANAKFDYQLTEDHLKYIISEYKRLVKEKTGNEFPSEPRQQLDLAVGAVFASWNNQRAIIYRRINRIADSMGTAVNVQSMVYGNMGADSATGVLFTRDPNTGDNAMYGEYLPNAQGEDVVAGIRTPKHIDEMKEEFPPIHAELVRLCNLLETHYKDMQDIEFTMERGKLFVLQTRSGKRGARAALEIAVDMVHEGLIDKKAAILRVEPEQLERLMHKGVDPKAKITVLAKGLPASPGAATGAIVFDPDNAEKLSKDGRKLMLVRPETSPDDMPGIVVAQGVLTSRGGMTCHAAIVARHMGKPCIVGCEALRIDMEKGTVSVGGKMFKEGDIISIDGATGQVIEGVVPLVDPEMSGKFSELLSWADEVKRLGVFANADTPPDAQKARDFGATGIGLTRTEHMFMQKERLPIVQEMILAETLDERQKALDKLLPIQQGDFYGILKAMRGFPVTIRLLDPPLHEFLPDVELLKEEIRDLRAKGESKDLVEKEDLLRKANQLHEANPMMGFRGCRLGVVYPEIYEMQIRAILQAAVQLGKDGVTDIHPEIMIPLIGTDEELKLMKELVLKVAADIEKTGAKLDYKIGTMIEVPRAALTADEIAAHAEFFSFGTNDLTQMTYGFSRDDAEGKFLKDYVDKKVLKDNPFQVLDRGGVGKLVKMAVELGRKTRPDLKVGICGEHGGEPSSIEFCHMVGLNYVSCSPFRVPVARLAAAHAALRK